MSIPLTAGASLHPLVLPARADAADAGEFAELARIRNQVLRETTGRDDDALSASALLPVLRSRRERTVLSWVVRLDGEMVGLAAVILPHEEGSVQATLTLLLLPRVWGRGIGGAALPLLEAAAAEHGRTVVQAWATQPETEGPRIDARTGFGSVPDEHVSRFLSNRGFALEQVYRISTLALDDDARARARGLQAEARAASADYRLVQWTLPTPDEHVDGYAWLKSRMSTDAPSAGLANDEEAWDARRVRDLEGRIHEMGRTLQVTAAQHIPTGELSAFSELEIVADERAATTDQADTLVLSAHRGHRLGMLVKCASLLSWSEVAPDSPKIITYNAEENRPMLSINEAMGFTPIAYEGAWKKVLE